MATQRAIREAKHAVCGDVAGELRARLERDPPASEAYTHAALDLVIELERRGQVVHRAPRPTADAPALALEHPDLTE